MKTQSVATLALISGIAAAVPALMFPSGDARAVAQLAEPVAIEKSMHEFMEYIQQPTFRRLKASIAKAPADNNGWKAIKSDSLILAESTNLLFGRGPKEKSAEWKSHAARVRDSGAKLYAAAKKKDYDASRRAYVGMIKQCNACHQNFADGEYQLEP